MTQTKGRKQRIELVNELKEKIDNAKSVVFTEYHGLTAAQISELRSKLRDLGAEATVAKNTLLTLAVDSKDVDLTGPTMTVFSYEDPVSSLKVLFEFNEEHEELPVIKAGIFEGEYLEYSALETLSKLPSREELLGQVVGGLKSPINGFVGVLGGVQRNFVYALAEIAKTKE